MGRTVFLCHLTRNPTDTQECLRLASIVCPNETELSVLTGHRPVGTDAEILAAAQRLHAQAAEGEEEGEEDTVVLVTLGPRGALLVDGAAHREGTWVKCPTVERVVDTSGAGDCLLGSLAAYWGRDMALEEAVGKACAVASLSVQRPGTQTSYPRAEELPAELRLPTSAAGV